MRVAEASVISKFAVCASVVWKKTSYCAHVNVLRSCHIRISTSRNIEKRLSIRTTLSDTLVSGMSNVWNIFFVSVWRCSGYVNSPSVISNAPSGWTVLPDGSKAYKLFKEAAAYDVATQKCMEEGARIAMVCRAAWDDQIYEVIWGGCAWPEWQTYTIICRRISHYVCRLDV